MMRKINVGLTETEYRNLQSHAWKAELPLQTVALQLCRANTDIGPPAGTGRRPYNVQMLISDTEHTRHQVYVQRKWGHRKMVVSEYLGRRLRTALLTD